MDIPWFRFEGVVPDATQQQEIQHCLRSGKLIILPTDTVYGVAADERAEGAEAALFDAKQRPDHLLIPRLAANIGQIAAHGATLSPAARRLAERFWPGALTLILSHPTLGSVGYRIPEDPVALSVLEAAGYPLLVTSANQSGEPETTTAEAAYQALAPSISMVLDAGPAPSKVPSSVVKLTGEQPEILRAGAIDSAAIEDTLRA